MAGRIGSGLGAPASEHDGSCPGSMCWRLEVYAPSRPLPSVIHKGACGDQERDYFACIEHGESLGEAPRRWVLRLSVRRVWLDGGGLTLHSRGPPMCRPTLSPPAHVG